MDNLERTLAGFSAPADQLFRYLDTNGDGTGMKDATGDYSSAATYFYIEAPQNETYVLNRMIVKIRGSTGGLSADGYGNIAALTNGILVHVRNAAGSVILDLTDGLAVKLNADWNRLCFDAEPVTYGAGDNFVIVRWTFANSGSPIVLSPGQSFGLLMNDNLSSLNGHFFHVQGFKGRIGFG